MTANLKAIDDEDVSIDDPSEVEDEGISNAKYQINSYGADYTVDSIVQRLKREDIYIPPFQRGYVWNLNQASKFIESLLLGLPVPGIFLSRDEERKMVVIDGQQRLRTLEYFYRGLFGDREFSLSGVQKEFRDKTYASLSDEDRRQLDDSILHATIVQQLVPEDDDSSIYHIFQRLNTGGTKLQPQEIRVSIYHGPFMDLLYALNNYKPWREIYGPKNKRAKDQELILRFLAFYFMGNEYKRPLNEFLNTFARQHRNMKDPISNQFETTFKRSIDILNKILGKSAFRPQRAFNAAAFDGIMVGLSRRLAKGKINNLEQVKAAYENLLKKQEFIDAYTTGSTIDETNVKRRQELATKAFTEVE